MISCPGGLPIIGSATVPLALVGLALLVAGAGCTADRSPASCLIGRAASAADSCYPPAS